MMIVTDPRIEMPWSWDPQSKPEVCFNSSRKACAQQYRSSKSSIHRLNRQRNICGSRHTPSFTPIAFHPTSVGTFQYP
jgi:hypothetical protein